MWTLRASCCCRTSRWSRSFQHLSCNYDRCAVVRPNWTYCRRTMMRNKMRMRSCPSPLRRCSVDSMCHRAIVGRRRSDGSASERIPDSGRDAAANWTTVSRIANWWLGYPCTWCIVAPCLFCVDAQSFLSLSMVLSASNPMYLEYAEICTHCKIERFINSRCRAELRVD